LAESVWDETVILDLAHLSGFTGGDPDFECQILDIFLDNAPGYLENLSAIDQENWKTTAHKLKGAARSIGAWALARAAERAEQMGSPEPTNLRRVQIIALLENRLAELIAFIEKHQQILRAKPL